MFIFPLKKKNSQLQQVKVQEVLRHCSFGQSVGTLSCKEVFTGLSAFAPLFMFKVMNRKINQTQCLRNSFFGRELLLCQLLHVSFPARYSSLKVCHVYLRVYGEFIV